jgi:hypothetical protein
MKLYLRIKYVNFTISILRLDYSVFCLHISAKYTNFLSKSSMIYDVIYLSLNILVFSRNEIKNVFEIFWLLRLNLLRTTFYESMMH